MARAGKTVCVVVADGEVDIIQEAGSCLNKHIRDLKKMGCTVKVHHFSCWADANDFEERKRGW